MPRSLSNPEWAAFMQSPNPNTLAFPPWGGVVNWGGTGQYVLCFQMPSGEWALSDVTDGIPFGSTTIDIAAYVQTLAAAKYTPAGDVFWNTLPGNFMQQALVVVAQVGSLATGTVQVTADQVSQVLDKVLHGISSGLGPSIWPIAIVAAVVLIFVYGKK